MPLQVRTVATNEELLGLREAWDDVLTRSGEDNAYLTHEWLAAWWIARAGRQDRLHVVCCYEQSSHRLVGILPLYLSESSRPFRVRKLTQLGQCQAGPGCIADARLSQEVYLCFVQHLYSTRADWDVLSLRYMDARSDFASHLVAYFANRGCRTLSDSYDACPQVSFPRTWDTYLGSLSRKRRQHVRQGRRRLDRLGAVEIEDIRTPELLSSALDDVAGLFEASMMRRFQRPYRTSDAYRRFLAEASPRLLAEGRLRLRFLTIESRRVAFMYEIRHGDTLFWYQTGLAAAWAQHGAGTVLQSYTIERAIEEGCLTYDLGLGWSDTKRLWGASGSRELCDITAFGESVAARLAPHLARAVRGIRCLLKTVLPERARHWLALERSWHSLQRF